MLPCLCAQAEPANDGEAVGIINIEDIEHLMIEFLMKNGGDTLGI